MYGTCKQIYYLVALPLSWVLGDAKLVYFTYGFQKLCFRSLETGIVLRTLET